MSATIDLVGPSTDPTAPPVDTEEVNTQVNAALLTNANTAATNFGVALTVATTAQATADSAAGAATAAGTAANTAQIAANGAQATATTALANAAAAATTANAALPKAGGIMNGNITLVGDAVSALQPSTKQQLDAVAALVSAGLGGITVKGVWNAATNSPSLASGVGTQGDVWVVGVAGTTSLDGNAVWAVADQALFTSGTWKRAPMSTAFGTMSIQNANNVTVTGGSTAGQTTLGLSDGTNLIAVSPIIPGYAEAVTDSQTPANLAWGTTNELHPLGAGVLWINQAYIVNTQFGNPLNIASITVSGDQTAAQPTTLPIANPIADSAGTIGMFYMPGTNAWHIQGNLAVSGSVSSGVSSAPAPSNSIDVTSYGALLDMQDGHFFLTFSATGTTVTAYRYAGSVTLAVGAGGTALVTLNGSTADDGVAFQPDEVGGYIHVPGGGPASADLVAQMIQYVDGQNMLVSAASITALTGVTINLLWPCWRDPSDKGKTLYIDGAYPRIYRAPVTLARVIDTTLPYAQHAYMATISAVAAPNQLTVSLAFPQSNQPGTAYKVAWGTDDSAAIAAAGQAAGAAGARVLYYRGNGHGVLSTSLIIGDAWTPFYNGQTTVDPTIALCNTIFMGDNVKSLFVDGGGQPYPRNPVPVGSSPALPPLKGLIGRKHTPRLASLTTAKIVITGDSLSTMDPQKQSPMWGRVALLIQYLREQNPDKTLNIVLRGWGGATWSRLNYTGSIDSIAANQGQAYPWMTDTTKNWLADYILAEVPDAVFIMMSQGNDGFQIHPLDVRSVINQIRAISHGSGPATDVVLMTDFIHAFGISTVPGQATELAGDEYGNGLIRGLGKRLGFGVIEFASTQQQTTWGFDALHRWERRVPTLTATGSPTAPILWPHRCRDFGCNINLPGSTGAASWPAGQHFDIQVSAQPENIFRIGCNAGGNLTVYAQSWGMRMSTHCVIALNGTSLVVDAPGTSFTGSIVLGGRTNYRFIVATPVSGSGPFSPTTDFQSILVPNGGYNESLQRFYLREHASDQVCWMGDVPNNAIDTLGVSETITIGSHQFVPFDAKAQSDIVFFFSDGTTFQTKIVGYTDAQHVTLADPFPRDLSAGLTLDVFVGGISIPETDTGIAVTTDTHAGAWIGVSFKGDQAIIRYSTGAHPTSVLEPTVAYAGVVERFGGQFYPVITPAISAALVLSRCWKDSVMPISPSLTVWEGRGMQDTNTDLAFGGSPAHPGSRWGEIVGRPVIAAQDFSA